MSASYYTYTGRDPLWRRFLINAGCDVIEASQHLHSKGEKITWRDHVAWAIEGIGGRLFSAGFEGSEDEIRMAIQGGIQVEFMSARQLDACVEFYGEPLPLDRFGYIDNEVKEAAL